MARSLPKDKARKREQAHLELVRMFSVGEPRPTAERMQSWQRKLNKNQIGGASGSTSWRAMNEEIEKVYGPGRHLKQPRAKHVVAVEPPVETPDEGARNHVMALEARVEMLANELNKRTARIAVLEGDLNRLRSTLGSW